MKKSRIIVIVGPNASGKSALGVKIAKKMNGEIISADSRQVYKGLNIGSGKITKKEMRGVPHHCLSIADPKKVFTALDFKNCAERAITDILSREKTPIIVGGTGFYIDAALGRIKLGGVPPNQKLRRKLSKYSTEKLLATLKKLDPLRAKTIEQKNPVRLIRAIEIAKAGKFDAIPDLILTPPAGVPKVRPFRSDYESDAMPKKPHKSVRNSSDFPDAALIWLGIKRDPKELKKRIKQRLNQRLNGIIQEVKKLRQHGLGWKRLFELGLEYRYASLYLRGLLSKEEMLRQLEIAIWHYAKRQMTWFKKNKEIRWISSN